MKYWKTALVLVLLLLLYLLKSGILEVLSAALPRKGESKLLLGASLARESDDEVERARTVTLRGAARRMALEAVVREAIVLEVEGRVAAVSIGRWW